MKTTNYLFVAFGAAALTLTACNNDDDVLNSGQEPGVVNIVTSINGPQTRVPVLYANAALASTKPITTPAPPSCIGKM